MISSDDGKKCSVHLAAEARNELHGMPLCNDCGNDVMSRWNGSPADLPRSFVVKYIERHLKLTQQVKDLSE